MIAPAFYRLRVEFKRLRSRVHFVASFCKHCGRNVHDFHAPDAVWEQVEPHIRRGHVLCYDCFAEVCAKVGLPAVWELGRPAGAAGNSGEGP